MYFNPKSFHIDMNISIAIKYPPSIHTLCSLSRKKKWGSGGLHFLTMLINRLFKSLKGSSMGGHTKKPKGKAVGSQASCQKASLNQLKKGKQDGCVSCWVLVCVCCSVFGRARDEKLSEFLLRRKWNLRKAEACIFFFFLIKRAKTLAHKLNSSLETVQTWLPCSIIFL